MDPVIEDALTLPTALAGLGAVLFWLAGLACLGLGALRGRARLGLAAAVQLVGAPAAVGVAYFSLVSYASVFGAERMAGAWLVELSYAALVVGVVLALSDALVAFAPPADR